MDEIIILKAEIFDLNIQINLIKKLIAEKVEKLNDLQRNKNDRRDIPAPV